MTVFHVCVCVCVCVFQQVKFSNDTFVPKEIQHVVHHVTGTHLVFGVFGLTEDLTNW